MVIYGLPMEEGLAILQRILAVERTRRSLSISAVDLQLLAEQCLASRCLAEARVALDEAFDLAEQHEIRLWKTELHRLSGELLLAENRSDEADQACFQSAAWVSFLDRSACTE